MHADTTHYARDVAEVDANSSAIIDAIIAAEATRG